MTNRNTPLLALKQTGDEMVVMGNRAGLEDLRLAIDLALRKEDDIHFQGFSVLLESTSGGKFAHA